MYRAEDRRQLELVEFYHSFGGKLDSNNRWVILSRQIPWEEIEKKYGERFCEDNGAPAKTARMALGALIIEERLGLTDRETVEQIRENPYLQYFLGLTEYSYEAPFHHSLMTHFRKRFDAETLATINELIVAKARASGEEQGEASCEDEKKGPPTHKGKLLVDATCTPADIAYPTDLNLLNEAREKTEEMIDAMHEPFVGKESKPRTYRKQARRDYLSVAKQKQPKAKRVRKGIRRQLQYLERNLKTIDRMGREGRLVYLSKRLYELLSVVREVARQQRIMYKSGIHRIAQRIVNLYQSRLWRDAPDCAGQSEEQSGVWGEGLGESG